MAGMGVDRRTMLAAIAAGVVAAVTRPPVAGAVRLMVPLTRVPAPVGVLMRLPGDGNQLALTVDDGASSAVVAAFGQFCSDTGTRLTFFVNGANASWSDNAPALRPMVDSGQIQMGNHPGPPVSQPAQPDGGPRPDPARCRLHAQYVWDRRHSVLPAALRCAHRRHRSRGRRSRLYDRHTVEQHHRRFAPGERGQPHRRCDAVILAQPIVLADANLPTITPCYNQLSQLIAGRNLQTVTLNDVFS